MSHKKDLFTAIRQLTISGINPKMRENELWEEYGVMQALVVLDSSGFTRVTREKGILHFLTCIVQMRDIIRPIFHEHSCNTYRCEADNIYAEFDSPSQALEASLEANRALRENGLMLMGDEPFQVCIGIGYGLVLRSGTSDGCFGDEMNLASKLGEDTAEGREILLTKAAYAKLTEEQQKIFEKKEAQVSGVGFPYYLTKG